jgi:hypothetical protein
MSARDELAGLIEAAYDLNEGMATFDLLAHAILAAGYSKPRTITTAEELDALPNASLILDALNYCREAAQLTDGNIWRSMGPAAVRASREIPLPATVLYTPKES